MESRAKTTIRLAFAHRASGTFHSIEELFGTISRGFPEWVVCREERAPCGRARAYAILANLCWAFRLKGGDLIHQTGDIHYTVLGMWRCPVVLTIHDVRFIEESRGAKRLLLRTFWLILPCLRANRITVISEFTRRHLLALCRVNPCKVRVIPNCVGEEFRPHDKGWPEKPRVLLCGTTPNKNWERVVEAGEGLNVQWVLLGRLNDQQKEMIRQRGWEIELHADLCRDGVVKLYQACDLLAFVSLYEGFGMPILEAQAIGRPVLTSDLSPMAEVAGDGALKVNPLEPAQIRKGLQRLLDEPDLRAALVEAGFTNVRQYSPESIAKQYAEVYREALLDR